jgi:hypothetical protein
MSFKVYIDIFSVFVSVWKTWLIIVKPSRTYTNGLSMKTPWFKRKYDMIFTLFGAHIYYV